MSEYYYNGSELYHYGVKGMKWGHRKASYAAEKEAYRGAKKELRNSIRGYRSAASVAVGMKGLNRATAAEKRMYKADMNAVSAKAKYKAAKAKNSNKAEKAEFRTYRKEMQKTGLAGSAADKASGGRSTRLYDSIKAEKGKAYADSVAKSVQNRAIAQIAVGATVAIGSTFVSSYLANRY